MIDPVDIDQIGVAARLVADDAGRGVARDIDGEGEPVADRLAAPASVAGNSTSPTLVMQPPQRGVAERGEPRRMRNCTRLDPVRTRMLNERGEISA